MVNVYLDTDGAVRSAASGKVIAPAGTTPAAARMQASLWTAAADVLAKAPQQPAPVTPITEAPGFKANPVAVVDVAAVRAEVADALSRLIHVAEDQAILDRLRQYAPVPREVSR